MGGGHSNSHVCAGPEGTGPGGIDEILGWCPLETPGYKAVPESAHTLEQHLCRGLKGERYDQSGESGRVRVGAHHSAERPVPMRVDNHVVIEVHHPFAGGLDDGRVTCEVEAGPRFEDVSSAVRLGNLTRR